MRTDPRESEYEELKQLVLETKKIAEEGRAYSRVAKNYIRLLQIWGIIKLIVIGVPLVLVILYAPILIKKFEDTYQQFLGGSGENLLEQLLKQAHVSGINSPKSGISNQEIQNFINKSLQKR